jgi:hypothetical protein
VRCRSCHDPDLGRRTDDIPDDYYEPFFNWPLVYLMGGGDHLLQLADRQWEAVTRH